MEPVPLCKGETILKVQHSGQVAALSATSSASSLIVHDVEDIAVAHERMLGCPIGMQIDAELAEEEDMSDSRWTSDWLIEQFRKPVDEALRHHADFLYLRMADTLQVLRAAVLAVTDVSGIGILVELPVAEDGCMPDGTPLMCALGILQRIGVAGLILNGALDEVAETIEELSPHACVALGCLPTPEEISAGEEMPEAEFYLVSSERQAEQLQEHIPLNDDSDEPDADEDYILAPVGRHVHFVDATIDISEPLDMEDHFEETLLELEDVWSGAVKLEISSIEDIYLLAENQYLLERPVCLAAENPELFRKALRVLNGIALYDGTWELDAEVLEEFQRHYGLVAL